MTGDEKTSLTLHRQLGPKLQVLCHFQHQMTRDYLLPSAEAYRQCVLVLTFVKRFANALDILLLVGRSSPTDSERFLLVPLDVANLRQRRNFVHHVF